MLALYRSERQAEALDVYRQGRNLLSEELGLEPGEPLRRLERSILEHDPSLAPPPPVRAEPADRRPGPTRHRWAVALVAALVAAGAAAGLAVALTHRGSGTVGVVPNSVAVLDPKTNEVVDDVPVGLRPIAVAAGEGGAWVCREGGTVWRLDLSTRKVVARIDVGTDCHDVAVGFDSVWVAGGDDGTVIRIDPGTNSIERRYLVSPPSAGVVEPVLWVAAGAGSVWATQGSTLVRIDPVTGRGPMPVAHPTAPAGLAAGPAFVWVVTAPGDDQVVRFDRRGIQQTPGILLPTNGASPAADATRVWLVVYLNVGDVRSYSDTGAVNIVQGAGRYPLDVAVGEGAVWVVNLNGTVSRISPRTDAVVARVETAPTAQATLSAGGGAVWVAVQQPT